MTKLHKKLSKIPSLILNLDLPLYASKFYPAAKVSNKVLAASLNGNCQYIQVYPYCLLRQYQQLKKATTTFLKFVPLAKLVYIDPKILLPDQGTGSNKMVSLMVRSFSCETNAGLALKGKISDEFSKSNVSLTVFSFIYLYLIEASILNFFLIVV